MFNTISSQLYAMTCILVGLATLGCAGPAQITVLQGTCEQNFERCRDRCNLLEDGKDCELRCRFQGKLCARAAMGPRRANRCPVLRAYGPCGLNNLHTTLAENVRLSLSGDVTRRFQEHKQRKELAHVVTGDIL